MSHVVERLEISVVGLDYSFYLLGRVVVVVLYGFCDKFVFGQILIVALITVEDEISFFYIVVLACFVLPYCIAVCPTTPQRVLHCLRCALR